ncbi:trans-sulfuration enzyme family protein [Crossiella sp. NPDC003009]
MSDVYSDDWICTRLGEDAQHFLGAVHPPVYENSLFTFPNAAALGKALRAEDENFVYWRGTNPTVALLQDKLAALERAERAKCFGSGMGAISATLSSRVAAGDHVLAVGAIYGPTTSFLRYLSKFGVTHTHAADLAQARELIRPETSVVYFESPTFMAFRVQDIAAVVELARAHGATTIMDNTWATPLYQKPITMGVDLVLHSLSKYIGGHSDLVGGVVCGSAELVRPLALTEYQLYGAAMSPHDAAKAVKGLRTLGVRMAAHGERALRVAEFLESHPRVRTVRYPGLPSHPDHELARRQLAGFSGLLAFELDTENPSLVERWVDALQHFRIGVSWGGYESLVNAPAVTVEESVRATMGIPVGLVRLSVGLEDGETLVADLAAAFEQLG